MPPQVLPRERALRGGQVLENSRLGANRLPPGTVPDAQKHDQGGDERSVLFIL